jgi:hypothetical protein
VYVQMTREEAERRFAEWVGAEDDRRDRLHARIAATGGPVLAPKLDSLRPLNVWYHARAVEAQEDPSPGRPSWAPPPNPDFVPRPGGPRPASDAVMRLWDLITVHVADVLRAQLPGSTWICFRNGDRRDDRNGKPMLDIGWPDNPADVIVLAHGSVPAAVSSGRPFLPDDLHDKVVRTLAQLEAYRSARG